MGKMWMFRLDFPVENYDVSALQTLCLLVALVHAIASTNSIDIDF